MAAYQKWVAKYFVTGTPVPAALATQWMARMWQTISEASPDRAKISTVPFAPGRDEAAALVGPEGEILAASDGLCTMLGVREADVVGLLGCDFAANEENAELLRQSMLSPLKTPAELLMRTSSGQTVAVTAYPSDEKGHALQVTFIPRGVECDTTTEELPGIMVATMEGRIALVNDRLAATYGMSREQMQGRNVWELVVPEMQAEAKRRILTGATGPTRWPVCRADGSRVMVDAITTIETLNGQPMRVTRGWEIDAVGTENPPDALREVDSSSHGSKRP
jgi:PAS domain S-box-containing protein